MAALEFAPGTACGASLTSAQVLARRSACTERAIAEYVFLLTFLLFRLHQLAYVQHVSIYRLPKPQEYRQWKAAVLQQQKTASKFAVYLGKAAKWLCITLLTLALLACVAACPGLITSVRSLAGESHVTAFPDAQSTTNQAAASAADLANTVPQASASSKLFPEIKEDVESLYSKEQLQEACQDTDSPSPWLNDTPSNDLPEQVSKPVYSNWMLENSLLRAAELESELASRREENQQLSAHLLQATRQLAVVGQPVQPPGAAPIDIAGKSFHGNKIVYRLLLLLLAGACWPFLGTLKAHTVTSQQQSDNANGAEQVRCVPG